MHGGRQLLKGWCVGLLFLAGCPKPPPPRPSLPWQEAPGPIAVAVIEFGDEGREAENGCVMAVLEAGYRAVSRKKLEEAMPTDDVDYQNLGHLVGADMIIDGGIPRGGAPAKRPPPRLVSTRTGDLLAVARAQVRIDRSFKVGKKVCSDLIKQLP